MVFNARRYFSISLVALLVSACSAGNTSTPAAVAAQSDTSNAAISGGDDAAVTAQTALAALDSAPVLTSPGRALIRRLPIHPDAKSKPFLINFVSDGLAQGGVPCFSCVSGAQTQDNIGLTGPSSYVPTGAEWQYTLSFTNISFKGKCKLAWAIASGKKVIDQFAVSLNIPQSGGYVLYGLNRSRPTYSGSALLTGKVTCGKGASQTAQTPMYFQ